MVKLLFRVSDRVKVRIVVRCSPLQYTVLTPRELVMRCILVGCTIIAIAVTLTL